MKYPKEYLDEIKTRLKVSTVVSKSVNLKKRGKEYVGLSPFKNEKTPSFTVNDEKGFYHWHDNTIHIDPNQSPKEFILTCLHEIKHVIQTKEAGGPRQMQKIAEREWEKAALGEYGKRAERNPYKYVPFEVEAEKWAQNEYRKKWKNTYSKDF